jgi:hypothetical protein
MIRKNLALFVLVIVLVAATATIAFANGRDDLTDVRSATRHLQNPESAVKAGWGLVPGLDHCFVNPGVGAMGYHYINTELLDTRLDRTRPEAMVFATGPNGQLEFVAVEYIVPIQAWVDANLAGVPQLHGLEFHRNDTLGVYVLHAWIGKDNPAGLFADWNPLVTCP